LIDKVYDRKTLERAWESVRKNQGAGGIDRQSIEAFAKDTDKYLTKLQKNSIIDLCRRCAAGSTNLAPKSNVPWEFRRCEIA
jgi:hypothetical protein